MVVLKQIKSYELPALFPSKLGVIAVSVDNQVAVIHRKGALVLELNDDPCPNGPTFVTKRSILDNPKSVDAVSIRSAENSLVGGNKDQLMELIRDKILTPRNYDGIEFLIYFSKVEWSGVRLKDGPLRIPRCVLATLTSTFQLMIYGQLNEVTDEHQRNWCPLLNVSQTANMILREKWEHESQNGEDEGQHSGGLGFEEYKKRMYELTCIDFTWMGPFDEENLNGVDSELFMIVAHVNGSIDIWRIFTCAETENLVGEIVCTKQAIEGQGHIISAMKFQAVDTKFGVLTIGTNSGIVRIFRIEKMTEMEGNPTENANFGSRKITNFRIQDGIEIWERDDLAIENFLLTTIPPEDRNILKRVSVDVLFHKHSSVLCTTTVSIFGDGLIWNPVKYIKLCNGRIVGFGRYSNELLMCCHESGVLSLVYHKHGDLKYMEGSANSIKDVSTKGDIYRYNGFGFSANKGLAFVGKNLSCFYDHNIEKDPGRIIVFSTLSLENTWETVKEHFAANDYCLQPIADILMAFRYQLRTQNELDIDKFLDGTGGPLDIAPQFLKLYLWILRAMCLQEQRTGEDESNIKQVQAVRQRRLEVEDELLQRHYISLLESIDESMLSKLNLDEAQSLFLIQQFLNSKPNLRHLSFEPAIIPTEAPKCVICESEVDFVESLCRSDEDPLAEHGPDPTPSLKNTILDAGKVAGFHWSQQQCTEKHTFAVCILSLLPCPFPYRKCDICGVVASMKPVFGMKPECPFCGHEMRDTEAADEEDCGDCNDLELEDLDDPPGIHFLGIKAEVVEVS